jgi:diguanylate cyclase (GGDEF)-like protein
MQQSLIKALGIIDCSIFKRVSATKFEILLSNESWLFKLMPEASDTPSFDYQNDSAYLNDFLIDAEPFWQAGEEGQIQSGIWSEQVPEQLLRLEAIAAVSDGECFLVINNLENEYLRSQRTMQAARELLLSNDKIMAQHEYVHQRLDALLSESQSAQELQHPISLAIEQAEVGVAILDSGLIPLNQNPALFELLGLHYDIQDQSPSAKILQLFENQYPESDRVLTTGSAWSGEIYWLAPPYKGKWIKLALYPVRDEQQQIRHWIMITSDITQVKFLLQNNEQLTHFDALTELPNRQHFWQQLEQSVNKEQPFFLLYLDIKHFKKINEIHGHLVGDQIIRDLAQRIKPLLKEGDILARVGGTEFAIMQHGNQQKLLLGSHEQSQCIEYANELISIASLPIYTNSGHKCEVGLNIGAASFPQDASDVEELMKFADLAVYAAKKKPKSNIQFYSQELKDASRRRIELENALRDAVSNGEFELFLQPILDLNSGKIIKAEALIRWDRPGIGMIGPDEFIPIAEQSGLIVPIGKWVFATACQFLHELQLRGSDIRLSVNLSPRQISDRQLLSFIHSTVRKSKVAPKRLELELTEGVLIDNYDKVQYLLDEVRKLGITVSIDDFGTGYSSLSYLQKLHIDHLKIDRTFVRDLGANESGDTLVLAILAMAQSLKLGVIAEGVETAAQKDFLQSHNCNIVQGYLFSRPVPFEDFCQLLEQQKSQ